MTGTIQQFNFDANILQTILWQYENAPNIKALLQDKQDEWNEDFTAFWQDFYTNIFDLRTANTFGLSVWSILLGTPIVYNLPGAGTEGWGFGAFRKNFTNGNFQGAAGTGYILSEETARVILRLRYYQLTGTCCVPSLNRMLADIFENYGHAYVSDVLDMRQQYVFNFILPADLQFAFDNFDVLPRPAGVGSSWRTVLEAPWGFNSDATNFDHGNFNDQ